MSRVRVGVKPGQWGWSFGELSAAWERIEALGFDVVSCFDHVSAQPSGYASWDAPTLLAAMAGRTRRVILSVDVLNVALRNPFLLASQLAVAQAASGGRLEVGLGARSYGLARNDHEALGIPFPKLRERTARLAAWSGHFRRCGVAKWSPMRPLVCATVAGPARDRDTAADHRRDKHSRPGDRGTRRRWVECFHQGRGRVQRVRAHRQ